MACAGGWGAPEADGETAVTGSTPFQVGSVSKAVTATLAMILVAAGELDLDQPVNDLLRTWRLPDDDPARDDFTDRSVETAAGPVAVRRP